MSYTSLENQIRLIMSEARKSAGRRMLDDWQKRVNARVDALQQSNKEEQPENKEKKD